MKKLYVLIIFAFTVVLPLYFLHWQKYKGLPAHITYNENIAPIIYKNCMPCHRPGQPAPYPLITYRDVFTRIQMIKYVTEKKIMPPWPADPSYSHFANELYLTEEEINMFKTWVNSGAPEGDPKLLPPPPQYPDKSSFGKPDLVLTMPGYYHIKGDNKDHFIVFKIPYEIERDTFIRFIEFVPDNNKLLHHMNGHLIQYMPGKKHNNFEDITYVDQELFDARAIHEKLGLANDDGTYPLLIPSVVNYLPGVTSALYPEGIGGYPLSKMGALYVNTMHYGPSPVDDSDRSYFNIFFDSKPPERTVKEFQMGTLGVSPVVPPLIIPPDTVERFYSETTLQDDISLLTINPHMHLLGKSFLAYAILPGGDTLHLIRINNWDFHWQYFYTFRTMMKIPHGTIIRAEGIYDNTSANPNNPFSPPRSVAERFGSMRTTDEMFQLIITYLPYKQGDENIHLDNVAITR